MKLTNKLLITTLRKAWGNVHVATKFLKNTHGIEITRDAIDKRIRKHSDVREALDCGYNDGDDIADHEIMKKVIAGDFKSAKFRLERKDRKAELKDKKTGGFPEDKVIDLFVTPKKEKGMKSEAGCDNLKEKEQNNDNSNN